MEGNLYNVEQIRSKKFSKNMNRWVYLIKWAGYDTDESTWEPEENLCYMPEALKDFNAQWELKKANSALQRSQRLDSLVIKKRSRPPNKKMMGIDIRNSNLFLDRIDNEEIPLRNLNKPGIFNQISVIQPELGCDQLVKIIGIREVDNDLYIAAMFNSRNTETVGIGTFRISLFKIYYRKALQEYLQTKIV